MITARNIIARGICPHLGGEVCEECRNYPSQLSYSWREMADLTHKTQVEIFNWCGCEDNEGNENPYSDCPVRQ